MARIVKRQHLANILFTEFQLTDNLNSSVSAFWGDKQLLRQASNINFDGTVGLMDRGGQQQMIKPITFKMKDIMLQDSCPIEH